MKTVKQVCYAVMVMILILVFTSCHDDDDDNERHNLRLEVSGLENLGSDFVYEGWILVHDTFVSTGRFSVYDGGYSSGEFTVDRTDLANATAYMISVEPNPDTDTTPSETRILAGSFDSDIANLTVEDTLAIGNNFESAAGTYILATPTNGPDTDELSGVWWFTAPGGVQTPGLSLPVLPSGWNYEGWAIIDDEFVSTGKFTNPDGPDDSAPYSSTQFQAPPFPGEDFLMNAPDDLIFPTNLSGQELVISVEPNPDNSEGPFSIRPLVANIPLTAADHTPYSMANEASDNNPVGTARRR